MAAAPTRVYTDDTRLFWQQLAKVAAGGAAVLAVSVLCGIDDMELLASAAAAVAILAVMILLAWRVRASRGRASFVLDGTGLHYRRRRRGQCAETRYYDLGDIASVQLRMHVGSAQSLEFGSSSNGLPELRIETRNGRADRFQVVALDFEGCDELRSFITLVCDSAGMEKRRSGTGGPVAIVDRWDQTWR